MGSPPLSGFAAGDGRCASSIRPFVLISVFLAALAFALPAPPASAADVVPAATVAARLAQEPVTLTGRAIVGDLVLRGHLHRFTCRSCRFQGIDFEGATLPGFAAPGSAFTGMVDVRGATLGSFVVPKSRFEAPLLADATGATGAPTTVTGDADFSLDSFAARVTFEYASLQAATFALATFEGDTVFAAAQSTGGVTFERAIFGGDADFTGFLFGGDAAFHGTAFRNDVDFTGATFSRCANFAQTRFGHGVTFVGAMFAGDACGDPDTFSGIHATGDLNFAFARLLQPAIFDDIAATGTLSFRNADIQPFASRPAEGSHPYRVLSGLTIGSLSLGGFDMSVQNALHGVVPDSTTPDARLPVLSLIETSARQRGDLSVANDALYAHAELKSQHYSFPVRMLDLVFYRGIAGYFVRPLRTLGWLFLLATILTVLRDRTFREQWRQHVLRLRDRSIPPGGATAVRVRGGAFQTVHAVGEAGRGALDLTRALRRTLFLIVPGSSRSDERERRHGEVLVYGVLLSCALIGFANSNPTLRDMLNAIH
jgi:hypothetical protein